MSGSNYQSVHAAARLHISFFLRPNHPPGAWLFLSHTNVDRHRQTHTYVYAQENLITAGTEINTNTNNITHTHTQGNLKTLLVLPFAPLDTDKHTHPEIQAHRET